MDFNRFLLFTCLFMFFTVIGTISHELGHIAVAKILGYETTLHFGSMNSYSDQPYSKLNELLIIIGGPLQTILTSTIGLLILYLRRNRNSTFLNGYDWFAIFLALFSLRPIFNLIASSIRELFSPNGSYFGGDELKIANQLLIWEGTISLISAIIGGIIAYIVIFKVISKPIRLTFILSGIVGGLSGFIIWYNWIGPILLP